jgi:hypothetical protein
VPVFDIRRVGDRRYVVTIESGNLAAGGASRYLFEGAAWVRTPGP